MAKGDLFSTVLRGFHKEQVSQYLNDLIRKYEREKEELNKKYEGISPNVVQELRQENDRLAGAQLEVIIHHLADGVLGPVVVIAQLLLCLIIAGAEHREASGRSGTGRFGQRCGADDKGDAAGCDVRGRHGGVGAADVNTMICHSM